MSWDEALFATGLRWWKALRTKPDDSAESKAAVLLQAELPRLRLLAAALAGEELQLQEAEAFGGWRGRRLFLPAKMAWSTDPYVHQLAYTVRVLWAVAQRRAGLVLPPGGDAEALTLHAVPATCAALAALAPHALDKLRAVQAAWPGEALQALAAAWRASDAQGAAAAWARATPAQRAVVWQCLGQLQPIGSDEDLAGPAPAAIDATALSRGTERKGKPREHVVHVQLREDRVDENPLVHTFEKVHTADSYQSGRKQLDGSDELADHTDALDEVDLRHVIRTTERAESVYRSDAVVEGAAPDLQAEPDPAPAVWYDEWFAGEHRYRPAWCAVRSAPPRALAAGAPALQKLHDARRHHARLVRQLRAELDALRTARRWRDRQLDGDELDLAALVDRMADLRSGTTPPDRLYSASRRAVPELAALVLLDTSLSSDAWVGNRRVLDVSREAADLCAAAFADWPEQLSLAAFHSHTRRDCTFATIKDFAEPLSVVPPRLAALVPTGYTRIGAALRHATAQLANHPARRRLLVLVSDARPTDYDRYEGRHGIADVRQAVREAAQAGVVVRVLAVDAAARATLPQMVGPAGYALLAEPAQLLQALPQLLLAAAGR